MPGEPVPVRWVPTRTPRGPLLGWLSVGAGEQAVTYRVAAVQTDQGRAFRVSKRADGATYFVCVTPAGKPWSCECLGWLRWNRCLHTRELGRLVADGTL